MISVIIPSIRPANLKICLDKFLRSQQDANYEIIEITDKRDGPIEAICRGIKQSKGEYIFFINDQCSLSVGGLKIMENFSKKYNDKIIVGHRNTPITPLSYYGIAFEPYPFVHRSVIEKLGGLFLPKYKHFYADSDLALRAYIKNIPLLRCPHVSVHRTCDGSMDYTGHKESVNANYEKDKETFINFWWEQGFRNFREISPGKRSWLWCRFLELLPY